MKPDLRTLRQVLPTALLVGGVCGLCAAWVPSRAAAVVLTLGAALATAAAIARRIQLQAEQAYVLLRRPELRDGGMAQTGVYEPLIRDCCERLSRTDAELLAAVKARDELGVRFNGRQKQIRRLEMAVECLPMPILIADDSDRPVVWNVAAVELFGGMAAGGDQSLPLPPDLSRLVVETRTRSAATRSRSLELQLEIGGNVRPYRAAATHLVDGDGSSLGVIAVLDDIGGEQEARSRHAEFVSSVCHELKTPMSSMKAFIEMLMDGDVADPEEQLRLYGFIDVQIDRLTRLVNNMLNLARIESGVIKIQREDCGLNDVLEKALEVVRPMADEKQIRLIPQFSPLYLAVHVDRDLFGQGVINLLSNAIKYTPEGGEVRLKSRLAESEAVLEVQDTGMGIPADDLHRIFERFFRVEQNCKAAAGTGLGLALVQYIVADIHNGRISVQSRVNEGSCFTVAIPLGHRDKNRRKAEQHACTA